MVTANDDVAEPALEIDETSRQAERRHNLGRDRDVKTCLPREPIGDATQRGDDCAQRPIVHVHDPAPGYATNIEVEGVAPVDVVVEESREEIVGGG